MELLGSLQSAPWLYCMPGPMTVGVTQSFSHAAWGPHVLLHELPYQL